MMFVMLGYVLLKVRQKRVLLLLITLHAINTEHNCFNMLINSYKLTMNSYKLAMKSYKLTMNSYKLAMNSYKLSKPMTHDQKRLMNNYDKIAARMVHLCKCFSRNI